MDKGAFSLRCEDLGRELPAASRIDDRQDSGKSRAKLGRVLISTLRFIAREEEKLITTLSGQGP